MQDGQPEELFLTSMLHPHGGKMYQDLLIEEKIQSEKSQDAAFNCQNKAQ